MRFALSRACLVMSVTSVNLDSIWNLQATVNCVDFDRGTRSRYLVFDAGVPRLDLLTEPLVNRAPTHTKNSVNGHGCRFELVRAQVSHFGGTGHARQTQTLSSKPDAYGRITVDA